MGYIVNAHINSLTENQDKTVLAAVAITHLLPP